MQNATPIFDPSSQPEDCRETLSWTFSASSLMFAASNSSSSSVHQQLLAASLLRVIAIVVGLPLNFLALFVFCRCSLRRLWTTLLLQATCLTNVASIMSQGIPEAISLISIDHLDLAQLSPVSCSILTAVQRVSRVSVAAMTMCLAEDRISSLSARYCLKKPHSSARNVTRCHLAVIFLIIIVICVLYLPLALWYGLSPDGHCSLGDGSQVHILYAFLLQLLLLSLFPLAFLAVFLVAFAVHLVARTDCNLSPPPADHWANKLAGCTLSLYAIFNIPRLVLDLLQFTNQMTTASCHNQLALQCLLDAVSHLHTSLTPLLYTACSRFRQELLFTTCCTRYAMTVQPRDSVMVQNRC